MTRIRYCPIVPEEPQPQSRMTQWSLGIAMFAAFVIPFILLLTSARYRVFVAQAQHAIDAVTPVSAKYNRDLRPLEVPSHAQKDHE
jgi:hypothetical protein